MKYSIYYLLFFLLLSKQISAMKEENSEAEYLTTLLKENKTITDFKNNILKHPNNRKNFLRILARPYSPKNFNLSLLNINWDIGNFIYDPSEGYKTNMIGGMHHLLI